MFRIITAVIGRDLKLAMRRQADIVSALFFFIIVVSLFPLGVGPEPGLLRSMAPGVVWVAALLASMLSLARMFSDDYQDGKVPYYPVPASDAKAIYEKYRALAEQESRVSFVGRLATYRYYNMDQAVGAALARFRNL